MQRLPDLWNLLSTGQTLPEDRRVHWKQTEEHIRKQAQIIISQQATPLPSLIEALRPVLEPWSSYFGLPIETVVAGLASYVEFSTVTAASIQESLGDEQSIGHGYFSRLLLEVLQNLRDALALMHGSQSGQIGRFGVGIKGMALISDQIRLSSASWQLIFGDGRLKQMDFPDLPLFTFPLPDHRPWVPIELGEGEALLALRFDPEEQRWWFEVAHRGMPFNAYDVHSFTRRRASVKQQTWDEAQHVSSPFPTRLAFRLRPDPDIEGTLRRELETLTGEDTLFLPHLRALSIHMDDRRRTLTVRTVEGWTMDELRYELVETGEQARWLIAHDQGGRAAAFPIETGASTRWIKAHDQEGQASTPVEARQSASLYSFFRITDADTGIAVRLHLPQLSLDQTRERLGNSRQAQQKNGEELNRAVDFLMAILKGIDRKLREGGENSAGSWLARLIRDFPAPLITASGPGQMPSPGALPGHEQGRGREECPIQFLLAAQHMQEVAPGKRLGFVCRREVGRVNELHARRYLKAARTADHKEPPDARFLDGSD